MEHVIDGCTCEGKKCTKCKKERCLGEYTKDSRLKTGLKSECRICANAQNKKWRQENKEYHAARKRAWNEANADHVKVVRTEYLARNAERLSEQNKQRYQNMTEHQRKNSLRWYYDNKDRRRERRRRPDIRQKENAAWREYYQQNKDYHNTRVTEWRKNNPRAHAAINATRRARKVLSGGKYTQEEWKDLLAFYGCRCLSCGRDDVELHADHIVPISKGGSSNIDNIQPLCRSCNSSKGTKIIDFRPQFH